MPAKKRKDAQTLIRPAKQRSHFAVLPQTIDISARGRALWNATIRAIWPYTKQSYPGWTAIASALLHHPPGTLTRWRLKGCGAISAWTAMRIIAILDARIAEAQHLRQQWQAYEKERLVIEVKPSTGPGRRKKIKALDTNPPSA
jgi:hypothetical protein